MAKHERVYSPVENKTDLTRVFEELREGVVRNRRAEQAEEIGTEPTLDHTWGA